jgi:alpha-glucosidase
VHQTLSSYYLLSTRKWKLGWLLLFAVLASCGAFSQTASPAPAARITPTANGLELTDESSIVTIQVLENGLASVHTVRGGNRTQRTLVMAPHPVLQPPAGIKHSHQSGFYGVSTPNMTVRLGDKSPYRIAFLDAAGVEVLRSEAPLREAQAGEVTLVHAPDEPLYGMRGLGLDDYNTGIMRNGGATVAAGIQGDSGAPLVLTTRYAVLIDSDGGKFTSGDDRFTFHRSSRPDVEYFVSLGTPMATMAAVSRLVGPPPMAPKWTLGFLNSQWGATQSEVEQIVGTYREKRLPLDGFILDFDWKAWGEDNYGEWRWNSTAGPGAVGPNKFPDGASGLFAQRLAAQGVRLGGILKPRILTNVAGDANKLTEAAAYAEQHHFWYPGEPVMNDYFSNHGARDIDFGNPEARAWYWEHLKPAFNAGMVSWWNDEADVSGSTVFNNFQFLNMGRALYEGQRAISDRRVWSINRGFYLGASRYGYAGWSGDIPTGYTSMQFQARRMLAALNTGEFHWSMDTGGFFGRPAPENYARWMQFAAFVPIMRVHVDLNQKRQPWVYGPVAEAAAKKALELRYTLMPYMYSYERLNSEGQVGLVRPLLWMFPNDGEAAAQDSEWMFGDALLVSPVLKRGATSKRVYLPEGDWFDYSTGKHYAGANSIELPLDTKTWKDIPLFVRSGSIVATQALQQYVGQKPVTEITLDVFPAARPATFTVYDDDGETYAYENGAYLRQAITSVRKAGITTITLNAATGKYAGAVKTYLLRVHTAAHSVSVNGKRLTGTASARMSDTGSVGWTLERDRFGTVALVRVTAGEGTTTQVVLR